MKQTLKKFEKMSDSEMEIMKVIWELATPVTVTQLLEIFGDRNWKIQTVGTFLTRLTDKGLLTYTKYKKANVYTAAMTEQRYNQLEAQSVLSSMYDGSLQNFLSALYVGDEVNTDEIEELKKWFDGVKKND